MNIPRMSAVVVAALSIAVIGAVSMACADNASNSNAAPPVAADNPHPSGQTLEIPPAGPNDSGAGDSGSPSESSATANAPGANAPGAARTWSDGSQTYTWKDESAEDSDQEPESSTEDLSYAGVDEYMNQELQAEAMGPAFSPFFGSPFMYSPYGYNYYYYPVPPPPPPPYHPRPPVPPPKVPGGPFPPRPPRGPFPPGRH